MKRCLCGLGQHCTNNFLVQCCLSRIWTTMTRLWVNIVCIVRIIVLCNVAPSKPRQHCVGYFPAKTCLCAQGQYCKSFLVQRCLKCKYFDNIEYAMFVCNLVLAWCTQHCIDYFAKESCLLTMGQHCTGNFFAQYWLKWIKATLQIIFLCKVVHGLWSTLHILFSCAMLAQTDQDSIVQFIFLRNHVCTLWVNITEVIFLRNVVSN